MCKASQVEKDCLACVATVEHVDGDVTVDDGTSNVAKSAHRYCCITGALSQQQDFLEEKPLIQTYIERDSIDTKLLQKFFRKCWWYMDAYEFVFCQMHFTYVAF